MDSSASASWLGSYDGGSGSMEHSSTSSSSMSGHEMHENLALAATGWSSVSSAGFLIPSIILSILFILFDNKKKKREREIGGFAVFMIMLELIDAIPEAAVIAQSTVNKTIGWSFVLSILSLNIVNTSASAIDFLATSNSKKLHRFLFALLFFSVGMLVYSISADVYGKFAELFKSDERTGAHMACLLLGTFVGYTLIIMLMRLEHKLHAESEGDDETLLNILHQIHQQLIIITPKLQEYFQRAAAVDTILMEGRMVQRQQFLPQLESDHSPITRRRTQEVASSDSDDEHTATPTKLGGKLLSNKTKDKTKDKKGSTGGANGVGGGGSKKGPKEGTKGSETETEDIVEVFKLTEDNVRELADREKNLRQMETLVTFLISSGGNHQRKLAIFQDFSAYLTDKTLENLDKEEFIQEKRSEKKKRKEAVQRLLGGPIDVEQGLGSSQHIIHHSGHHLNSPTTSPTPPKEETPLVPRSSIYGRAVKFIGFMIIVFVWSVGLTTVMALFLMWLERRTEALAEYMEAFCEGLSGGAFLSTVSGTMIFRIQQDFYGSEWEINRSKTIGMSCFVFGIIFSNFIAMLETSHAASGGHH
eukprot:TRINITY_DN2875_c0_g1_i2.p1 TRINITY_DN2875_c0_g1~~TRINITY_DN2875_c0_g1_i2.p1  ORF type:complete len:589 (+),score=155.59 TRINITY_DN2875_c0_g1_i2:347-2113(+)